MVESDLPRARTRRVRSLVLSVQGYKAIRNPGRLQIAPLTLISGVNSSGKSSFMQPFLIMKQTLESTFDPGALLLHGPNVKITDRSQILSRGKSKYDVVSAFSAGIEQEDRERTVTFESGASGIDIRSDFIRAGKSAYTLREKLSQKESDDLRELLSKEAEAYVKILSSVATEENQSWDLRVLRNRCFLDLEVAFSGSDRGFRFGIGDQVTQNNKWIELLRGIIHVPGLRGNPERSYARSAVGTTFPGTFETYVASIVLNWAEKEPDKLAELSHSLEALGLTWKIVPRRLDDASVELMVGRMFHGQQGGAHDLVSVADVGFGVSQTLPVVVALQVARPGQIVYIEQPEIHLHPRAQLALVESLVSAAKRGVYVIAETHSALMLRGVQAAVAEGKLLPNELSLNWFGRDDETGYQTITPADIDSDGRLGEWPADFDDVSSQADWAFLDAVEARKAHDYS